MFLRSTNRKKDGKDHRYFRIVENRRLPGDKTVQRTVLYLGEINDQQQAAWRKICFGNRSIAGELARLSHSQADLTVPGTGSAFPVMLAFRKTSG